VVWEVVSVPVSVLESVLESALVSALELEQVSVLESAPVSVLELALQSESVSVMVSVMVWEVMWALVLDLELEPNTCHPARIYHQRNRTCTNHAIPNIPNYGLHDKVKTCMIPWFL